ncbi:acid-resistance protein [Citrobacter amalonaticus]|uniref:Acid-resistance protein n=1 Tax=Citrobacter amalonaticus TaxID=35703 RepID=A0A2S4RRG1_CITAM|nr:HdeD family acid-resistance protein [Citrobacter amalonaticus]POT58608.1 acid-resistance protein [Citrobacter amalonaticus]POT70346.1 acid-resistance protein [Citrobacter amalonaticus]POU61330.1 acid-resistance protein [Citrobacter amalonaticus]POV05101.1 acid-resistance protein [Citrobacter amalonaticus]
MLNVTRDILSKLDDDVVVKQRRFLRFLACLMFPGGVLFILFPYVSGGVLSILVGGILMCSGIALTIGLFKNRSHNFWSVVAGVLVSVAYILMGYFFITAPELGVFAIATFLACLFCLGGVIRLTSFFKLRKDKKAWLQGVIGILDLFIAWCFITASPQASIYMVSMVTGIELMLSAISFAYIANQFRKP